MGESSFSIQSYAISQPELPQESFSESKNNPTSTIETMPIPAKEIDSASDKQMLRLNQEIAAVPMPIYDQLYKQHELLNDFLERYIEITYGVQKTAQESCAIYEEAFGQKLDKNEIIKLIFTKITAMINETSDTLRSQGTANATVVIDNLLAKLEATQQTNSKNLHDLAVIAQNLNIPYKKAEESIYSDASSRTGMLFEKILEDPVLHAAMFDFDIKKVGEAGENGSRILKEGPEFEKMNNILARQRTIENATANKFDSRKIEWIITHNEDDYQEVDEPTAMWLLSNDLGKKTSNDLQEYLSVFKKNGSIDVEAILADRSRDYNYTALENSYKKRQAAKVKLKPHIDILKKYLRYQKNLERKFQQLIFGQESAGLPKNFNINIEQRITNYQSELTTADRPYLPVGISSELPQQDELHAKPIDSLAYLFWLQNQGVSAELMVVDTIQTSNYQARYGLSSTEARAMALENGDRDKEWYRAIIEAHNLDNLSLTSYQEIEQYSGKKNLLDSIDEIERKSPLLAQALQKIVPNSIASNEKENYRQYSKDEIAFILAKPEKKISHEREYKYDILARVIKVYQAIQVNINTLPELAADTENQDATIVNLALNLAFFNDYAEKFPEFTKTVTSLEQGTEQSTDSSDKLTLQEQKNRELGYINTNIRKLGLSGDIAKSIIDFWQIAEKTSEENWFKDLHLPEFHYAQGVTGMSFEMRDTENGEISSFKEFYSTSKGASEEDLAIESNQIIASTSPLAAAKLLVLSHKKQKEYARKILQPIIVNYLIATSKDKEEALMRAKKEMGDVETVSDAIRFIQNKIITPIESKLKH